MTINGDKKQFQYHFKDQVWKASRRKTHVFAKDERETSKKLSRGSKEGRKKMFGENYWVHVLTCKRQFHSCIEIRTFRIMGKKLVSIQNWYDPKKNNNRNRTYRKQSTTIKAIEVTITKRRVKLNNGTLDDALLLPNVRNGMPKCRCVLSDQSILEQRIAKPAAGPRCQSGGLGHYRPRIVDCRGWFFWSGDQDVSQPYYGIHTSGNSRPTVESVDDQGTIDEHVETVERRFGGTCSRDRHSESAQGSFVRGTRFPTWTQKEDCKRGILSEHRDKVISELASLLFLGLSVVNALHRIWGTRTSMDSTILRCNGLRHRNFSKSIWVAALALCIQHAPAKAISIRNSNYVGMEAGISQDQIFRFDQEDILKPRYDVHTEKNRCSQVLTACPVYNKLHHSTIDIQTNRIQNKSISARTWVFSHSFSNNIITEQSNRKMSNTSGTKRPVGRPKGSTNKQSKGKLDQNTAAGTSPPKGRGSIMDSLIKIKDTAKSTPTKVTLEIPGLADTATSPKAPMERSINEKNTENGAVEKIETTYKIQIQYRSKIIQKDVDVVEKMKCLMARFFQYEKSVQLVPFDMTDKSNPITTAKDIPSEPEAFQVYIPEAYINPKSKVLKMCFKITAERQLWRIKMIPAVKNYLNQYNIYLDETYLATFDNVKVGCLILSHPQYTRRDVATRDLNDRINENEDIKTPIQLCPHSIWHGKNTQKISSKALSVECAKGHSQMVKHRLFTKLLSLPDTMTYSNTRYFKFIPFTAVGAITDKVIRAGIYLQNKYLIQTTAITMINISSLTWEVPKELKSFQEVLLMATVPYSESKIFTSAEMGILDNKVHLLTTKTIIDIATRWVDSFTAKMYELNESEDFWRELTGFVCPPERNNRPINSDANAAYANYLDQSIFPLVGEEVEHSGAREAPSRPTYSRVVYGSIKHTVDTSTSDNTRSTGLSTITNSASAADTNALKDTMNTAISNMHEESKKGQKEMRLTLLQEMQQISKEHTARANKIEESVEIFDSMVKELHQSNKAKSQEMETYKKRLDQIGAATESTAKKVDVLTTTMNNKVDKLNLTMKAFINVMTNVVKNGNIIDSGDSDQEHNLNILSDLLEEDVHDDHMDIDDVAQDRGKTKKSRPSPDTKDVLGGEGSRR